MLKIKDIIELKSANSLDKLSFATRYLVQVNFTFDLTLQNDNFSGTAHFCVRKDEIEKLCADLKQLTNTTLNDNDSDAFIEFKNNDEGVFIKGQIGGTHEEVQLHYNFLSNQIAINKLINDFENLLLYVDEEEYEGQYNYKNKPK